jgi:hypothetical protein
MDIPKKIMTLVKLIDLQEDFEKPCKDCAKCTALKGLKDQIILLSAEIIADQSFVINGVDPSTVKNKPLPPPTSSGNKGGNSLN